MKDRSNVIKEIKSNKKLGYAILYFSIFILWIVVATLTSKDTGPLVFLLGFLIAGSTAISSFLLPNERDKVLATFKYEISAYLGTLLLMSIIQKTLNSQGLAFSILTNMYYIALIITPIGIIGLNVSKIIKLRGIGKTKRETIEYYKEHGNDGNI